MTLEEWMYEEEQRLMDGIKSWKAFQENKEESAGVRQIEEMGRTPGENERL